MQRQIVENDAAMKEEIVTMQVSNEMMTIMQEFVGKIGDCVELVGENWNERRK